MYLRTAGMAILTYSYLEARWNLITLTTLLIYMMLVQTDVMKSIIMTISKTRLMLANEPGKVFKSTGSISTERGLLLS